MPTGVKATGNIQQIEFYNSVYPVLKNYADVGSGDSLGTAADGINRGKIDVVSGKLSNAYDFDGSTTYCDLGTSLSQFNFMHNQTALWTCAFWMKCQTLGEYDAILENDNEDSNSIGFRIIKTTSNAFQVGVWNGNSATPIINFTSSGNYVPDSTNWYFYVFRWDVSLGSSNLKIRRNDANEETGNKTANTPTNSNATNRPRIGSQSNSTAFMFNGLLDEMSIWNRLLTAGEETALYNSGNGAAIT